MIELLHCDCMEYMANQPDNSFDLAIVDPPYGIGQDWTNNENARSNLTFSKNYKNFHGEDKEAPEDDYFTELSRVSKNQIIWGANHFSDKIKSGSPCWIVWDKQTSGVFADCELAYTSFKTAVRKFTFQWSGMLQGDMKNKDHRIHPTQKPVKLYEWLLTNYAEKGQRILDTHAGSMSSVIACHYFGCDIVACEIDNDYFEAGKKRVDEETRQIDLLAGD